MSGITSVVALDSLTNSGVIESLNGIVSSEKYLFVHGDIRDADLVSELLNDVDAVIYFAAASHAIHSIQSSVKFVSTNMIGVD